MAPSYQVPVVDEKRFSFDGAVGVGEHWKNFRNGIIESIPVMFVYLAYGIPFGVLAVQLGMPAWVAIGLSFFGLAGAAQFLALQLLGANAGLPEILVASGVLNLRHIFYAMALALRLPPTSPWMLLYVAHATTDESFGINMARDPAAEKIPLASVLGTNAAIHASWVGATVLGVLLGQHLPSMDIFKALLPIFFAVLLSLRMQSRRDAGVALLAAALTIGALHWFPSRGAFLIGALASSLVMMGWRQRKRKRA